MADIDQALKNINDKKDVYKKEDFTKSREERIMEKIKEIRQKARNLIK